MSEKRFMHLNPLLSVRIGLERIQENDFTQEIEKINQIIERGKI